MIQNSATSNSILDVIGNTPLVKLHKIGQPFQGELYAKLEGSNPGHSSKDRIALYIVEKAEASGFLKPGGTIIETTSGNTGFSLAMVAAVKGYNCICVVNSKTSPEKIQMLKAMGAEVTVCPAEVPAHHPDSYYSTGKRLSEEISGAFYVNQYFNQLNIEAHYMTTGKEIWHQTRGQVSHVIAGSGTGGTISGIGRYLKEQNPNIEIIGVDAFGSTLKAYHETGNIDPESIFPYRIEGVGKNLIPGATDFGVIDRFVKATDAASAFYARDLAKMEGILAGYSSGATLSVFHQIRHELPDDSYVVLIFPDHGSRYLSKVFNDSWMSEQGLLKSKQTNGHHSKRMKVC